MPNLADVVFYSIFWYENDITVRGCAYLFPLSRLVIGELYPFVNIPSPEMYEYCMNTLRGSDETTDLYPNWGKNGYFCHKRNSLVPLLFATHKY